MRINGDGGTIRSLGISGQAVGGIDEVEQPAISNTIAHSVMLLSESMSK